MQLEINHEGLTSLSCVKAPSTIRLEVTSAFKIRCTFSCQVPHYAGL